MGKTPVPLTIVVDSELGVALGSHPWLDSLVEKGHTIIVKAIGADLVLSPKAHYWHPTFWATKYLEAALKAARAGRKRDG